MESALSVPARDRKILAGPCGLPWVGRGWQGPFKDDLGEEIYAEKRINSFYTLFCGLHPRCFDPYVFRLDSLLGS